MCIRGTARRRFSAATEPFSRSRFIRKIITRIRSRPSTVDVDLPDGTGDDDYLAILEKHLMQSFHDFHPDLLFYVAGADPIARINWAALN